MAPVANHPSSNIEPETLIEPAVRSAGTVTATGVHAADFSHATVVVSVGTMESGATLDVKVTESDSSDSGFTDVPNAVFDQMAQGSDDDRTFAGTFRLAYRKPYIGAEATVATDDVTYGVTIYLHNPDRASDVVQAYSFNA